MHVNTITAENESQKEISQKHKDSMLLFRLARNSRCFRAVLARKPEFYGENRALKRIGMRFRKLLLTPSIGREQISNEGIYTEMRKGSIYEGK